MKWARQCSRIRLGAPRVARPLGKRIRNGEIVMCARCGSWIHPEHKWDLGHVDGSNKTFYSGPEHAHCNRRTSAHKAERKRRTHYAWVDEHSVSRRW